MWGDFFLVRVVLTVETRGRTQRMELYLTTTAAAKTTRDAEKRIPNR